MKKLLTLLFLLSGIAAVRADEFSTTYGLGVVHVDLEVITDLKFYGAAEIGKLEQNLKFKSEIVDKKKKRSEATLVSGNEEKWLEAETFDMTGMLFTMRVMEKKPGWYYVMVNNTSRQCYWIRIMNGISFFTWSEEVTNCLNVKRKDRTANTLRKALNSNTTVPYNDQFEDCFEVVSVQGVWMCVKTKKQCADGTTEIKEGWFRWRDDRELLITFTPAVKIEK